jgi:hypothetical protein
MIAAGIAGVFALGTIGYFANEWRVCSGMEEDYLRNVEGYAANVYSGALASSVGVEVDKQEQGKLQKRSLEIQQMQIMSIYDRCGSDAGRAAAELASDEVRESMMDVLSIP